MTGIFSEKVVVGTKMERALDEFVQACEVHIEDEQSKILPDNSLISILCDSVRLARKFDAVIIERNKYKSALIAAGKAAGALLSETCSLEFLMNVPNEISLVIKSFNRK
jgi:hypothetical protein